MRGTKPDAVVLSHQRLPSNRRFSESAALHLVCAAFVRRRPTPALRATHAHCASHASAAVSGPRQLFSISALGCYNSGAPKVSDRNRRAAPLKSRPRADDPAGPAADPMRRFQMLSRRIASAATRSAVSTGAKPLPLVQRRTFFPPQMNSPKVIDEKYPDHPKLTEAEDPGQVSAPTWEPGGMDFAVNWGRGAWILGY